MKNKKAQFKHPVVEGFKAARVIESLENYAVSDKTEIRDGFVPIDGWPLRPASDEAFWKKVLSDPHFLFGKRFSLDNFHLSSWVPRVPGLYWTKSGEIMRQFAKARIEEVNNKWTHYTPTGKSSLVLGGIGSLELNPDSKGNRIASLSSMKNASTGIPVLISSNVWHALPSDANVRVKVKSARWMPMEVEWEQRFQFTAGIPRGYLLIEDSSQLTVKSQVNEYVYHPFSIMEYEDGNAVYYDYVFATVSYLGWHDLDETIAFFDAYRKSKGRNGHYLIAADTRGDLLKAQYGSPQELLRADASGKTFLDILTHRVRDTYYKGFVLDDIIHALTSLYSDEASIKRLALHLRIPVVKLQASSTMSMINSLMNECVERNSVEVLVDKIVFENPTILNN